MTDNKYTQKMSALTLSQRKKNDLIQKLYEASKEQVRPEKAEQKKKINIGDLWIGIVAASLAVVIICSCCVLAFVLNVNASPSENGYTVDRPLDDEARLYLSEKMKNAQYLPNVKLLAGTNESNFGVSSQAIATLGDYTQEFEPDEYCFDDSVFDMGLEDFGALADDLGRLDSALHANGKTVEDIKSDLMLMLKIIPGYDQWFMMPRVDESFDEYDYNDNIYKLSYDEKTGRITMMRIEWETTVSIFDSEKSVLYSSVFGNDCYQRELLTVEYYLDEQNREVVECNNTRYYYHKGQYYPVSVQILKNVKDTETTKMSVYFTIENQFVEEYYSSKHDAYIYTAYTLQDIRKYGAVTDFVQLDYTDSDDVRLLKIIKKYPSMFTGNPSATNMAFYRINGEDKVYYSEAWDYLASTSEGDFDLKDYFGIVYDGELPDKATVRSFLTSNPYYYNFAKSYCKQCVDSDFADSDFIRTCEHLKTSDTVSRGKKYIAYNPDSKYREEDLIREDLAVSLESLYKSVMSEDKTFVTGDGNRYVFETAVDDYTKRLVEGYIDLKFDFDSVITTIKTADDYEAIQAEDIEEILEVRYLAIRDFVNSSSFEDGVLNYDISYTVTSAEADLSLKYYMAIYLKDYEEIFIIDSREIDMSKKERSGSLKGSVSCEDIVGRCPWKDRGNAAYSGEICVSLISVGADGSIESVTAVRTLEVEGAEWEKESVYDKNGCLMKYYFRIQRTVYFNFYVYH